MMGSNMVYLISFATREFYQSQKNLNSSALKFGVDKVVSYKREDIIKTDFYKVNKDILDQKRGAGFWLWKPYIILDILEKASDGDIVIYSDAGIEVISDLNPLIELCRNKKDVLIFCDGGEHLNKEFTKRDCFIMMDCDSDEYWNSVQCLASFHIYIKNDSCVEFLNKWLFFCRNKHILTDVENICGKDNFSEFKEHRWDQSVLSLLSRKTKKEIFRDPTQWGNHLKMKEFRINEEFCLKKYTSTLLFNNSPYGTLLNHHRERKINLLKRTNLFLRSYFKKIINLVKIFNFYDRKTVDFVCPLCRSESSSYAIGIAGESRIIACNKCTNAWTYPPPRWINYEEKNFFSQFSYQEAKDLPDQWRKAVLMQANLLEKYLPKQSKILEIGCGEGLFLRELLRRGFVGYGIEPSIAASEIARKSGLKVTTGYFPGTNMKGPFDAIVAIHVLEHASDYLEFLKEVGKLVPGGIVLIVQSNWRGLVPSLQKEKWHAWAPEHHFWHFTTKGLKILLETLQWKVMEVEYSSLYHKNSIVSRSGAAIPGLGDQFHMIVRMQ